MPACDKRHGWIHIVSSQTLVRARRFTQIKSSIPLGAEDGAARPPITASIATEHALDMYVYNIYHVLDGMIAYLYMAPRRIGLRCFTLSGAEAMQNPADPNTAAILWSTKWSRPLRERRVTQPRPGWINLLMLDSLNDPLFLFHMDGYHKKKHGGFQHVKVSHVFDLDGQRGVYMFIHVCLWCTL